MVQIGQVQLVVLLVGLTLARQGSAHAAHGEAAHLWSLDPWVLVPLLVTGAWYGIGLTRLWWRAGIGRGGYGRPLAFLSAFVTLVLALVWPLEVLSGYSFAAHMIQHMLLLVGVPPLMVMARPLPMFLLALPRRARRSLVRGFRRGPQRVWSWLARPSQSFVLHGVTLWLWHIPIAFDAALASNAVHILEHASFLVTALLFWWSLFHTGSPRVQSYGLSAFWVLSTLMHSGFLGALLTFAPRPLYQGYVADFANGSPLWGLTLMEDQQLAGVIMWVPAGILYLIAGLVLVGLWLQGLERRDLAAGSMADQAR